MIGGEARLNDVAQISSEIITGRERVLEPGWRPSIGSKLKDEKPR
ncbi:MAG: hypothetical protein R3264_13370 [Anaerolineae bacterium]|nr:hypothetical protein [Anaerolineae bacterium]